MKKIIFKTLTSVLVLSLILTGCGNEESEITSEEASSLPESSQITEVSNETDESPVPKKTVYDDTLIEDLMDETLPFTHPMTDSHIECNYKVPQLVSSGSDAERINAEIKKYILPAAKKSVESLKVQEEPQYWDVTYNTAWIDGTVNLVIEEDNPHLGTVITVYNYDFINEKEISNKELLDMLDVDTEDFLYRVRSSALDIFDRNFMGLEERAAIISKNNINLNNMDIFFDDKVLTAKINLINTRNGIIYDAFIPVYTEPYSIEKEAANDIIKAELKGNKVTVTFLDKGNTDSLLCGEIEINKPYAVEGISGTIKDIYLDDSGMLFTIDHKGSVSCCDVIGCAKSGDRFFAENNIPYLKNISSFRRESDENESFTAAETVSGEVIDTREALNMVRSLEVDEMKVHSIWETEDGKYRLNFYPMGKTEEQILFENTEDGHFCEGSFFYAGLTPDGYNFPLSFYDEEGNTGGGILTISYELGEDKYEEKDFAIAFTCDDELGATPQKGETLKFSVVSEMDGTASAVSTTKSLRGNWLSADSVVALSLNDGNSAVFEVRDEDGKAVTRYEGTWRRRDHDILSLSLSYTEGEKKVRLGEEMDELNGSYDYILGMDGGLVLIPHEGAFAMTGIQKMNKNMPDIFYIEGKERTPFTLENSEDIKKAALLCAQSTGIKANEASVIGYTQTGILVRAYYLDGAKEKTKAWYEIDPETLAGRNLVNKQPVDFNSFL